MQDHAGPDEEDRRGPQAGNDRMVSTQVAHPDSQSDQTGEGPAVTQEGGDQADLLPDPAGFGRWLAWFRTVRCVWCAQVVTPALNSASALAGAVRPISASVR